MTRLCTIFAAGLTAIALLAGCQVKKSANPLSPAVAGPVEGVVISHPNLLEPGQDWELRTRDQPMTLLIQNADSNSERPLKYLFEIASDGEFKNVVFARSGVEPGGDGFTRLQLPDKLAAGTYWWRTRAEDGANTGPYSPVKSFEVLAPVVLAPPRPSSPSNGSTVSTIVPEFRVRAGERSGVTAELEYVVEVSNNVTFTSIVAVWTEKETWPETRIAKGHGFAYGKTYYWRARVWHTGDGADRSNWSKTLSFRTPEPPASAPPPPSDDGGGPSPSPSNPSECSSNDGNDTASCIEARYPSYLAAGVSSSRRMANMQFLRDRMIEHANCRGLDVGYNLKRGGPSISNDFVAWKTGGHVEGVDIASSYDDTGKRLNLMWHTYGPPNYGYPYYKNYGSVSCN